MQPVATGVPSKPTPSRRGFLSQFFLQRIGERRLRLRWRRVAAVALGLFALCYLGLAATAFGFFRYKRGLEHIAIADTLLPSRWRNIRIASGTRLIELGLGHARDGNVVDALNHLNAGLRQAPAHRAGRLAAAELRTAFGRVDAAGALLLEGLAYHRENADYVTAIFRLLLSQQKDDEAAALAGKLLQEPGISPHYPAARVVALAGATANFNRGNYDAAEDFLGRVPALLASSEARLLESKIDWERGYRDLAFVQLRRLAEELPSAAEVHHELISRLRTLGHVAEARRRVIAFQIANPTQGRARIELLQAYQDTGDSEAVAREFDLILRDFPTDRAALLGLAEFASATRRPEVASRVLAHAESRRLPLAPFRFLHIESLLAAGQFKEALATIRTFRDSDSASAGHSALLDSLQAVAYLGSGDRAAARALLNNVLSARFSRTESLIAVANQLATLDAGDEACRVLEHATSRDPASQSALTRLIELELNLNRIDQLPAHLEKLVRMRKPSPDILRVAHHKLGSDLFLFSTRRDPALDAVSAALDRADPAFLARH